MYDIKSAADDAQVAQDFLDLPKRLYRKRFLTQDGDVESKLIAGTHALSHTFEFSPFVIYENAVAVARFAFTVYPDNTTYIGFFECINNQAVAHFLFTHADRIARGKGAAAIIGPVDASFWIKYRLKTNRFTSRPYTSEPYNKQYYEKLFASNGYVVVDKYVSNIFNSFMSRERNAQYTDRLERFKKNDYKIVGINKRNFDTSIRDIYDMVMELYADFPVFKRIDFEDFYTIFKPMKYISTPSFAKVAYHKGQAAGFVLTLPNYGALLYRRSWWATLKIMALRLRAPRYVMLYIGVRPAHRGLGKALIKTTVTGLYLRLSPLIGALIHEGKPTQNYAREAVKGAYEYVLMRKEL